MILCDASPLVALIDQSQQPLYDRCQEILPQLTTPLLTTWPCFTEAMYLLLRAGGWPLQRLLWRYVETDMLHFYTLTEPNAARMRELMEQYKDQPMDLADASLVVAAESLDLKRVFTLDSHFHAYRIGRRGSFEVVP